MSIILYTGFCSGPWRIPDESCGSSHGTLHDCRYGADHVPRASADQHQQQSQVELPGCSKGKNTIALLEPKLRHSRVMRTYVFFVLIPACCDSTKRVTSYRIWHWSPDDGHRPNYRLGENQGKSHFQVGILVSSLREVWGKKRGQVQSV